MGWNTGFAIFEETVIGAYDLGKLDMQLLGVLMEPYRGTDIDSGGKMDLSTKDGKFIEQVVIEMHGKTLLPEPDKNDDEAMSDWYEDVCNKFNKITSDIYGWR